MGSGSEVTRALVLNVTRLAGLFGNASVGYRISGRIDEVIDINEILGEQANGRLFMREGQPFSAVTVPISSQVRKRTIIDTSISKSTLKNSVNNYRGFSKYHSLYGFEYVYFLFKFSVCFPAVFSVDVFVSG